ncbi:odorant receptor 94a [Drosophila subobscura]|uniref:odorant receptor 94a n=1 Tax=Drosophila subobscura TaxID=7241 RepID=UPI00155A888D|nr:odorant receptor 94a [Drosophila subobscura]
MDSHKDRIASMHLILQVMRLFGLWPWSLSEGEQWTVWGFVKRNYRFLLHLPITFTFIGLMWLEAFVSSNLEQAGQVLYMSITEMALVIKILSIWHYRTAAWRLMHEFQQAPELQLRSQAELDFWQREQRHFKWFFYIYILISLGVVYSGCTGVLFLKDYELPFAYYVPFEWRNERGYWLAYGYDMAGMTLTCISNITLDTLGCYFLFHISLLYRLLGKRLRDLQNTSDELYFGQELRQIFRLHHSVRRLTHTCQTIVSPYILSQIILSALIICFSGYRLQHVGIRANPGQFIAMLQFVSVMILQIYLPCFYGNEITVYAHQLTNEVYHTNWLHCRPPLRKLLNGYMEHLKRPVAIRAGNFFAVGLPIFVKTINNAYSFFALLLNVSK